MFGHHHRDLGYQYGRILAGQTTAIRIKHPGKRTVDKLEKLTHLKMYYSYQKVVNFSIAIVSYWGFFKHFTSIEQEWVECECHFAKIKKQSLQCL